MEMGSHANSTREVSRWRCERDLSKTKKVHWSPDVKDNHANSTREASRWRGERDVSKTKKDHWSPDVKDNHRKTPEAKSSAMGSPKKRDSFSSHSGGSYKSHRRSSLESPSKLQKINETSEARFLTAEEVIKRASIEFSTITHVGPTEVNSLASSKSPQIIRKSHSLKSSTLVKKGSPLAPMSRQSYSSGLYQDSWRSESNENEESSFGSAVEKSKVDGELTAGGAEYNPFRPEVTDVIDRQKSTMYFSGMSFNSEPAPFKHEPPEKTARVLRKRRFREKKFVGEEDLLSRMNTGQEDGVLGAASPEKVGSHERGGADALMPEMRDCPDRSTELINNTSGLGEGKLLTSNDRKQKHLQSDFPRSLESPAHVPALEVIWTGNFDIHDKSNYVRYKGILAHPPAKVSHRVYNLSKQIPGALLFEFYPRHKFWPAMFQTRFPGQNDVALYFYPSHDERSRGNYSSLLKRMVKDDLMLRSSIGEVQLLVYSSQLMPPVLQQLRGSYFMWGIFLRPKKEFQVRKGMSSASV